MLTLVISLLSTVIGAIIKSLVDFLRSQRDSVVATKNKSRLQRFVHASTGTLCAAVFKLAVQVVLFVC